MESNDTRAHGVTPGLRQDYVTRRADKQAAFVLPYLRQGMDLLDIGCGPGTITIGLAQAVSPGHVTGIDHDRQHIESAREHAADQGVANVSFQIGDAFSLAFEDGTFDVAFENNMFTHLAQDAVDAAREAYRVLKPLGLLAVRDVDADSVVWGHHNDLIRKLDELFVAWHQSRGSDITLGKQLPNILRQAGFTNTIKSVSADTKGTLEETRSHAQITISLLDGPFGRDIVDNGWVDRSVVKQLMENIREWGEHPDAFFANVHVEVIGWKPG
jgi:ubiquinone/menaquinone biosynthesis C-methylase UbiE